MSVNYDTVNNLHFHLLQIRDISNCKTLSFFHHIYFFRSICLSLYLCIYLIINLSIIYIFFDISNIYVPIHFCIFLFLDLFNYLSINNLHVNQNQSRLLSVNYGYNNNNLSIYLTTYLSIFWSIYFSFYLYVYPFFDFSIYLYIFLFLIYLFIYQKVY